ncbi:hypothetical protein BZA77DRAFT_328422 [Pyronema omphalodes]|nr:hypothetical protein BZA77DRAFT_328422 [Pyronema omphalodes]
MFDPCTLFSIASSVAGILSLAGSVSKTALQFISSIIDASENARQLVREISSLSIVLSQVQGNILHPDLGNALEHETHFQQLEECLVRCTEVFSALDQKVRASGIDNEPPKNELMQCATKRSRRSSISRLSIPRLSIPRLSIPRLAIPGSEIPHPGPLRTGTTESCLFESTELAAKGLAEAFITKDQKYPSSKARSLIVDAVTDPMFTLTKPIILVLLNQTRYLMRLFRMPSEQNKNYLDDLQLFRRRLLSIEPLLQTFATEERMVEIQEQIKEDCESFMAHLTKVSGKPAHIFEAALDDSKVFEYERLKKNTMASIDAVESLGNSLFMAQMMERNDSISNQLGSLLEKIAVLEAKQ